MRFVAGHISNVLLLGLYWMKNNNQVYIRCGTTHWIPNRSMYGVRWLAHDLRAAVVYGIDLENHRFFFFLFLFSLFNQGAPTNAFTHSIFWWTSGMSMSVLCMCAMMARCARWILVATLLCVSLFSVALDRNDSLFRYFAEKKNALFCLWRNARALFFIVYLDRRCVCVCVCVCQQESQRCLDHLCNH